MRATSAACTRRYRSRSRPAAAAVQPHPGGPRQDAAFRPRTVPERSASSARSSLTSEISRSPTVHRVASALERGRSRARLQPTVNADGDRHRPSQRRGLEVSRRGVARTSSRPSRSCRANTRRLFVPLPVVINERPSHVLSVVARLCCLAQESARPTTSHRRDTVAQLSNTAQQQLSRATRSSARCVRRSGEEGAARRI
jgi:hypothetical protein